MSLYEEWETKCRQWRAYAKTLESARAVLKHNLEHADGELHLQQEEIDRLKSEVDKWGVDYREAIVDQDILRKERDAMKAKAAGR